MWLLAEVCQPNIKREVFYCQIHGFSCPVVSKWSAFCKLSIDVLTSSKFNALPPYLMYFCALAICSAVRVTCDEGDSNDGTGWAGPVYGLNPPGFLISGSTGGLGRVSAAWKKYAL